MKIVRNFRNDLLKRKELLIELTANSTPSFKDLETAISEKEKTTPEHLVVKFVKGGYGSNNYSAEVFVYDDVKIKNEIEQKKKEKKK